MFQSGQVTAKRGNEITINEKVYSLHPEVTIKDDEEKSRELKDIEPGAELLFHLTQGRIDQIVLLLPR
jgi:hypothetical protein